MYPSKNCLFVVVVIAVAVVVVVVVPLAANIIKLMFVYTRQIGHLRNKTKIEILNSR